MSEIESELLEVLREVWEAWCESLNATDPEAEGYLTLQKVKSALERYEQIPEGYALPDGYRFSGVTRVPFGGEMFLSRNGYPAGAGYGDFANEPRPIIERIPWDQTAEAKR